MSSNKEIYYCSVFQKMKEGQCFLAIKRTENFMKKLLSVMIMICISLSLVCVPIVAEESLKIVSSSVMDGDNYASVSSLIKIEFDRELADVDLEDITATFLAIKEGKEAWSAVSISEAGAEGKVLTIRFAADKKFNTKYKLDLSKVASADGKKLSDEEKIISFKTFYGEEYKIQQEDFETGEVNPQKWRAPRDGDVSAVVQREGDNGNYCYRIEDRTLDINIGQNGIVSSGVLHKADGDKYLIEYDLLLENITENRLFFGISLKNTDANLDYSTYYKGTIGYHLSKSSFYVRADDYSMADNPKASNAFVEAEQGKWHHLMIYINKNERMLRLYVNGTLATNPDGKYEFKLPMSGEIDDDFKAAAISNLNFGVGGATGDYYIDNISIREISGPIVDETNLTEGMSLSTSCPEFQFVFRNNEVKKVNAYLNDEQLTADVLKWNENGSLSLFPLLAFGENYTLKLSAEDMFGNKKDFEYDFQAIEQPQKLIEIKGFFDGEGDRISAIKSGDITAKLRFWQKDAASYLLLAGVYKEIDGKINMLSLSAPKTISAEGALAEDTITVSVPSDTKDCFVRVFILKDSLIGLPYERNLILGDLILK